MPKSRPSLLAFLLTSLSVTFLLLLTPGCSRGRHQGTLTGCKSNLKNIATAMEMYATDYGGYYPDSFRVLTPNYLKTIPACPTQIKHPNYQMWKRVQPDSFLIYCPDHQYPSNLPATSRRPNYPAYESTRGLITSEDAPQMTLGGCRNKFQERAKVVQADHKKTGSSITWEGCVGEHLDEGVAVIEVDPIQGYREVSCSVKSLLVQTTPVNSLRPYLAGVAVLVIALILLEHRITGRGTQPKTPSSKSDPTNSV